jgi:hypothetical protein
MNAQSLIEKIKVLSADKIAEIEDFVDFIAAKEQDPALIRAAAATSAPAFERVWSNPGDDAYDR